MASSLPPSSSSSDFFLIVPDAPTTSGVEFGVDCMCYENGNGIFRGWSMIPSGIHLLYHSIGGSNGSRQGFFFVCEPDGENLPLPNANMLVCPWNAEEEEINPVCQLSETSLKTLWAHIHRGDLNKHLAGYPIDQHHKWINLSSLISTDTLKRTNCQPMHVLAGDNDDDMMAAMNNNNNNNNNKDSATLPSPTFHFVDITMLQTLYLEQINGKSNRVQLLTKHGVDKSGLLEYLLSNHFQHEWKELLGELQLSFVLFIMLYSYTALNHWKRLVHLICQAEDCLQTQSSFSSAFVRVLFEQLNYAPDDLFTSELSKDNFLVPSLSHLFASLNGGKQQQQQQERVIPKTLRETVKRLLTFVQKKFNIFETSTSEHNSNNNNNNNNSMTLDDYTRIDPYCTSEEDMPVIVYDDNDFQNNNNNNNNNNGVHDVMVDDSEDQHTYRNKLSLLNDRLNSVASSSSFAANRIATATDTSQLLQELDNFSIKNNNNNSVTTEAVEAMMEAIVFSSPQEEQGAVYSWRFPLLFEEMTKSGGKEDLLMTAMRIMDEADYQQQQQQQQQQQFKPTPILFEAKLFIEQETSYLK